MWFIILLHKIWKAFNDWRDENDISWGCASIWITVASICVILILGLCGAISSCMDRFEKEQIIEAVNRATREHEKADHVRGGDKIKITIQTKDGSQSFEGIFVDRYGDIITIKTDKGKMAFGGSFVIEEIK